MDQILGHQLLGNTGCESAAGRIRCGEPVAFGYQPSAFPKETKRLKLAS